MDGATIWLGVYISGIIIAIQGIVKLVMNWPAVKSFLRAKEGLADLIAGLFVAGIALLWMFFMVGKAILR